MIDCLEREVTLGDWVSVAKRIHNIAEHHIGKIAEIDEETRMFKVQGIDGRVTNWMNMYYLGIERPEYNKVILLAKP